MKVHTIDKLEHDQCFESDKQYEDLKQAKL